MASWPRPGPVRWLRYAVGGSLPPRFREWVLHDTTCPTWILRHLARSLLLLALPVVALALWLPAPIGVRALTAATAGACGLMFTVVHIIETTERRLIRAGYPGGTGEATRHLRAGDAQRLAIARRRERAAARAAARGR